MSAYAEAGKNLQLIESMIQSTLAQPTALLESLCELALALDLLATARLIEGEIDHRRKAKQAAARVTLVVYPEKEED